MGKKTFDVKDINELKELAKVILKNRDSYEPWLKPVENGIKGERRSRKLLGNEFWILDRDVDINGGDLIIQRKNLKSDILSVDPLELGLVQVKFIEKFTRQINIDVKYLYDLDSTEDDLILLEGFFLLIHFDIKGAEAMFCLDSKDFKSLLEKKIIIGKKIYKDDNQRELKKVTLAISVGKLQEYFGIESHGVQTIIDKINKGLIALDYSRSVSKRFFVGRKPNLIAINKEFEQNHYTKEIKNNILEVQNELYQILLQSSDYVLHIKDLLRLHPTLIIDHKDGEFIEISLLKNLINRINRVNFNGLEKALQGLKGNLDTFDHPKQEQFIEQYNDQEDELKSVLNHYTNLIEEDNSNILKIWHDFREQDIIDDNYIPDAPDLRLELKEFKKELLGRVKNELQSDFGDVENENEDSH